MIMPACTIENDSVSQPPQKKLKREPACPTNLKNHPLKNVKCAKSKLSLLPSLPLDVLFEIFGHLPPVDILHLARTTQDLRRVLMHKSAVSIWKSSLRQICGLPDCPPDMSEPAWVNLVYSPYCHNCFTHRVQKVDWLLRIRLCDLCVKANELLRSDQHLDKAKKLDKIVLKCIPFSSAFHIRGHRGRCYLAADKRKFLKDLQAANDDKSAFVQSKKEAMQTRTAHAVECRQWIDSLNQDRWGELDGMRDQRKNDITAKLVALGFTEELEYLGTVSRYVQPQLCMFNDHPDVKLPKPLTERSWKNMEQRIVDYMNEVRGHRLAADRLRLVRRREQVAVSSWVKFRLRYDAERLLPSGTDILSWAKVKAIIELPSSVQTQDEDPEEGSETEGALTKAKTNLNYDTEDDIEEKSISKINSKPMIISPASFTRVFESMSFIISHWENAKIRELARLSGGGSLLFSFSSVSVHLSVLQLATCVFTCKDKLGIHHTSYPAMWFPSFLHHACQSIEHRKIRSRKEEDVPENPLFKGPGIFSWGQRTEWSTDTLFFDEKASRAVKKLLEACGLDHTVATTEEMDKLDPRFICLKCSYGARCDGQRPRKVMPWRNAVEHCMRVHWGDGAVTWERITEASEEEARRLSAVRSSHVSIWQCAHCRDSSFERDVMKTEDLVKDHLDASVLKLVVASDHG
ncbi:hypothetical protein C8R43DRAFT_998367 [Mycena crocata]|nr:hypothetical protein C8R43DRAFT_998367 [Mycena crocata]